MTRRRKDAALAAIAAITLLNFLSCGVEAGPVRTSSNNCTVSQLPPDTEPTCGGNSTLTLAEAAARAVDYAPVFRTPPLETWHLQSPDVWYDAAAMLMTDTQQPPDATFQKFLASNPENFAMGTPLTYLSLQANANETDAARATIIAGAPYDAQNRSTAKIAFTVAPYNASFFVYTFHPFYSWAGCSNQDIVVNVNGDRQQPSYTLCLPGAQAEADWEHVSMLVCAGDRKVKQVAFGQRRWVEVRDCEREGQCDRDPESGRLVVYAALGTHGSYPKPSQMVVYDFVSGNFSKTVSWPGLGGLYFGDRTLAAAGRRWEPRSDLLVWVPPVGAANATAPEWARYGGTWGTVVVQPNATLTCIEQPGQNATVTCPGDAAAVNTIYQVTKLLTGVSIPEAALDPFKSFAAGAISKGLAAGTAALVNSSALVAQPPRRGPLTREYSMTWVTEPSPPIQSKNYTMLYCPEDLPVTPVVTKDIDPTTFSASASTIVNYIVGVAIGIFLFSLLLVVVMCLPALMDKKARVQRLVASKGGWGAVMETGARDIVEKSVEAAIAGVDTVDRLVPGLVDAEEKAMEAFEGGTSTTSMAVHASETPLKDEETGDVGNGAAAAAAASGAALGDANASPEKIETLSSYVDIGLSLEEEDDYTVTWAVWFFFGASMWAAGIGMAIYGTWVIFNQSIISAMLTVFKQTSLANTMEIMFILLLSVIAVIDLLVMFVLFFMKPADIAFFRWRVKNWLGGWRWAKAHEWGLSLTCVGFVVLALCLCAFYFALGFLITVLQVAARMVCKRVMSVNVLGTSPRELCVDLPFIGGDSQVCGWQALEVCAEMTNMDVRLTLLGSMMLLWAHVIFLVDLAGKVEHHRTRQVVIRRAGSGDAGADGDAPMEGNGNAVVAETPEKTE